MGECTPEHPVTSCAALLDLEGKIEIPRFSRLGDAGVNVTLGVLKAEPKPLVQRWPRRHAVVDQTDGDLSPR